MLPLVTRKNASRRRLTAAAFCVVPKAAEQTDRRKQRRALTHDEAARLLYAARWRPLAEFGRLSRKLPEAQRRGRKSWTLAPLTFATLDECVRRARQTLARKSARIAELERLGQTRVLIYKTLLMTGLRRNELVTLTVGLLDLDGPQPSLEILPQYEKARRGARIPLRPDLTDELRGYLKQKHPLDAAGSADRIHGRDRPLFDTIPTLRTFYLDLAAAEIPQRDQRGRTIDLHALRLTFGTYLSQAGVPPRVAQAALRHSTIDLTMNIYTDPQLLDVAGAVEALPNLDSDGHEHTFASKAGK